jgi:hypothetical protein
MAFNESVLQDFVDGHLRYIVSNSKLPSDDFLYGVTLNDLQNTSVFGDFESTTLVSYSKPLTAVQKQDVERVRKSRRFLIYEGRNLCRVVLSLRYLHNRVEKRVAKRQTRAKRDSKAKERTQK